MWVKFVVSSRPCSENFSVGTSVFPSNQKPTLSNSNWIIVISTFSCASGLGDCASTTSVIDILNKLLYLLLILPEICKGL